MGSSFSWAVASSGCGEPAAQMPTDVSDSPILNSDLAQSSARYRYETPIVAVHDHGEDQQRQAQPVVPRSEVGVGHPSTIGSIAIAMNRTARYVSEKLKTLFARAGVVSR